MLKTLQDTEHLSPYPSSPSRLQGAVDACSATGRVAGWAMKVENDDERVVVELLADGHVVAETVADILRADLEQKGIGDGRHGFEVQLPEHLFDAEAHTIAVREQSTGWHLPCASQASLVFRSLPLKITANIASGPTAGFFGCIDKVTEEGVFGWVLDAADPGRSLTIAVFLGSERIGTASTGGERPDLDAVLGTSSRAGWRFRWQDADVPPRDHDRDQEEAALAFFLEDTDFQLPCPTRPKMAELYVWVLAAQKIRKMELLIHEYFAELARLEQQFGEEEQLRKEALSALALQRKEHEDTLQKYLVAQDALQEELRNHHALIEKLQRQLAEQDTWRSEVQHDMQRMNQLLQSI